MKITFETFIPGHGKYAGSELLKHTKTIIENERQAKMNK